MVSVWCIGFGLIATLAVSVAGSDQSALDTIFAVNGITANGQLTFSVGGKQVPKLFEGDIVETPKLKKQLNDLKEAAKTGASPFDAISRGKWPGGRIPYTFGRGFVGANVVRQAIADFNRFTCVRWVPRRGERAYVEFINGGGCYSMIGRQGGRQQLSLARRGCLNKGISIHEMMHAAGFFHEQSRRDRDSYIRINWGNISPRMRYNFQMYRPGQATTLGEAYDKQSVMHYGGHAFSVNGQRTIVSIRNPSERLGQRAGFSAIDKRQLNKYYNCRTTTKTVRPPQPPPPTSCRDSYPFCKTLATNNWCGNSWVGGNCKAACGKCPSACKDLKQACADWSRSGYCKGQYERYMSKNCPKSCNKC